MAGRIRQLRTRRRGAYAPSCGGGAGRWRSACPHHEERQARARSRKREPARSGKIERLGIAPWLDNHGAERRTPRRFLTRPKRSWAIARTHQYQAIGRETKFGKTRRVDLAHLQPDKILPYPEDRPIARRAQRERHRKSGGGWLVRYPLGKDLVQRAARDTAAKGRIHRLRARREPLGRSRR